MSIKVKTNMAVRFKVKTTMTNKYISINMLYVCTCVQNLILRQQNLWPS